MLKRETSAIFKTRSEPLTYGLACNILLISLKDSYEWPESIAKVLLYWAKSISTQFLDTLVYV